MLPNESNDANLHVEREGVNDVVDDVGTDEMVVTEFDVRQLMDQWAQNSRVMAQMEAELKATREKETSRPREGYTYQRLSGGLDGVPALVRRFDVDGVQGSSLSDDKQSGRIKEGLKAKGLGKYILAGEEKLEDYVDVLAATHQEQEVTSAAIRRHFLQTAQITAGTRKELSKIEDLNEMFDFLAVTQHPYPGYCHILDARILDENKRKDTVGEGDSTTL